jgi:hypothetical protein
MFLSVMALVLFELVVFSVLTGNRAATFGILAVLGMMAHAASKSPWRHWAAAGAFVAAIILLQVLAQFRSEAADSGIRRAAWESVTEAPKTLTIDDVRTIQMFPQSFWHLLHTVDLYDSGAGRGGESFANVVPQAMPGFIADWVGFKRPVNDAAVLAGFKQHGGGMFVIAQGYWNFGFLGAVGTGAGIGMLVVLFERRFRSREPLLGVGYLTMIVASVFGLVYGLQSYVRALEIALLLAVAAAVYHRYIERRVTAAMRSIRWTGRRDAVPALRPGQRQAIQG